MDSNKKRKVAQIEKHKQLVLGSNSDISLTRILNSDACQRIICGCRDFRDRVYTPLKTVFTFIKQVLNPDKSCKKAATRRSSERIDKRGRQIICEMCAAGVETLRQRIKGV